MPKTLKEQQSLSKSKPKGGVAIKIQKPKLTIKGYVLEKENLQDN